MFASISSPPWPISSDPKAFDPKGAFMKFIKYMTGFSKKEKNKVAGFWKSGSDHHQEVGKSIGEDRPHHPPFPTSRTGNPVD